MKPANEFAGAERPSIFRSEPVSLVQFFVQADVAHATMEELGDAACVELRDLNAGATAIQRNFVQEVRQCDQLQARLRFIEMHLHEKPSLKQAGIALATGGSGGGVPHQMSLNDLGHELSDLDAELRDGDKREAAVAEDVARLAEMGAMLRVCGALLAAPGANASRLAYEMGGGLEGSGGSSHRLADAFGGAGAAAGPADVELGARKPSMPQPAKEVLIAFDNEEQEGAGGGTGAAAGTVDAAGALSGMRTTTGRRASAVLSGLGAPRTPRVGCVTGVVVRTRLGALERLLFRALHGNMLFKSGPVNENIPDPKDPRGGDGPPRDAFLCLCASGGSRERAVRVATALGAHVYAFPADEGERHSLLQDVTVRCTDLRRVLAAVVARREAAVARATANAGIWRARILRAKAVAHALNHFDYDPSRKCLIGEGWVPTSRLEETRSALRRAGARAGSHAPPVAHELRTPTGESITAASASARGEQAPSYFNAGTLLAPFQAIVDAYGVPRADELNPAPFSAVTFPFLFGLMFGDVGHGVLLMLFALSYIRHEKALKRREATMSEMEQFPWQGRYVLLLMGISATYAGLLYNDCFGCPLNLFGSAWHATPEGWRKDPSRTYPFGIDPAWHHADNSLSFINSYKMKLSIVFGVAQMSLGLACAMANALHRRSALDIWAEVVPQVLFLESVFGYLVYAIFKKWSTDWVAKAKRAPSLITLLIKFFMAPGATPPDGELFEGQAHLQLLLGTVALVTVPWMLCAKPYFLRKAHLSKRGFVRRDPADQSMRRLLDDTSSQGDDTPPLHSGESGPQPGGSFASSPRARVGGGGGDAPPGPGDRAGARAGSGPAGADTLEAMGMGEEPHEEEFDFFEVVVHQGIHTIEFVLGAVSNTASYLRLWALSLAHSQLSVVFWTKVLVEMGLAPCADPDTPRVVCYVGLVVATTVWFILTVMVLMCMESLSAFLHALRLHWVEFQNKFYKGDGRPFRPFSFDAIIAEADSAVGN